MWHRETLQAKRKRKRVLAKHYNKIKEPGDFKSTVREREHRRLQTLDNFGIKKQRLEATFEHQNRELERVLRDIKRTNGYLESLIEKVRPEASSD